MSRLALLLGLAALPARASDFSRTAERLLSTGVFAGAEVGVMFAPLDSEEPAFARSPDKPLIPASTAKLASSAAALEALGPEFRFRTSFLVPKGERGKPRVSSLVWRGDGDPSLSGRGRSSMFELFELWAASFTALGLARADRLVLDERAFDGPAVSPHWPGEELSYWYAAETSPISFNDNCVDLKFIPGAAPGAKVRIATTPDFGWLTAVNRATTGRTGSEFTLDYRRTPGTNRVEFFGSIPPGATRSDYVAVHDPAMFSAHTLASVWRKKGPAVRRFVRWPSAGLSDETLEEIFAWESAPLSELLKVINKNSQNFYAEQVLKALGKRVEGRGSFDGGLVVVRRFLEKAGLSEKEHTLVDGSGLAGDNRLTARGLVKILRHMRLSPHFKIYFESLAIPGVDKSAKDRMKGAPLLAAEMRVKRGTVKGARNLAGYLRSRTGRLYAFAVLVNGPSLDRPAVDAATDRLVEAAALELP